MPDDDPKSRRREVIDIDTLARRDLAASERKEPATRVL
jgi:hypothetical protein